MSRTDGRTDGLLTEAIRDRAVKTIRICNAKVIVKMKVAPILWTKV